MATPPPPANEVGLILVLYFVDLLLLGAVRHSWPH